MPSASAPEREVLHDLWVDHAAAVFGFLVGRVGRQDAEDLTSEVFVRAGRALGRYEERGVPVRAWLITIARNLVIERSRRARLPADDIEDAEVPVDDHQEHVADRAEQAAALAAMRQLPPTHRQVLDLRYLRELTVAESAEVLGLSAEAVRALTYRALTGLRERHERCWDMPSHAACDRGRRAERRMPPRSSAAPTLVAVG